MTTGVAKQQVLPRLAPDWRAQVVYRAGNNKVGSVDAARDLVSRSSRPNFPEFAGTSEEALGPKHDNVDRGESVSYRGVFRSARRGVVWSGRGVCCSDREMPSRIAY